MENLFVLISDSSRFNNNSLTELNCTISGKCKEVIDNLQINILYVFMEAMVAFFAVFGNAIVIAAFVSERKLRKRTNYYIVSLALADFLVGFVGIPIAIMISMGLPRNCQMCLMMMSLLLSFCTISIYSLLLISVDRFISILMPLKYPAIQNWATFEIALCWSIGCVIGFLPFAWHEPLPISRCFYHDVVTEGYQMFRFVFVILVPACTVFLIYWMIYREVLHQLKMEQTFKRSYSYQSAIETQSCIDSSTKREIKVTLNIFIIVLFFMACCLPLNIIKGVKILCSTCVIPDSLIAVGIVLTHFNSAINPLMYAYHLKDFRCAILKLTCCRRRETPINC